MDGAESGARHLRSLLTRRLRRLRRDARDLLPRSRRPVRICGGRAEGLLIGPRYASADYSSGLNELPVQEALARHLDAGGVLFDVGANVGFFALIGARLVGPRGHVYAFEPVPEIAAAARANASLNGLENVTVIGKAAAAAAGRVAMIVTEHPGGATLEGAGTPADAVGRTTVEAVTIDALVQAAEIRPPSVVKIDVEGAELDVLRGMRATLERWRPVVVYETDDADREALEAKSGRVDGYLASLGYAVEPLEEAYPGWPVRHAVATPP